MQNTKISCWVSLRKSSWLLQAESIVMNFVGDYAGCSFLEYFNTAAQTSVFSLSKHLHTPALSGPLPLSDLRTRPAYQFFNFCSSSEPPKTTVGKLFVDVMLHGTCVHTSGIIWGWDKSKTLNSDVIVMTADALSTCLSVDIDTLWLKLAFRWIHRHFTD